MTAICAYTKVEMHRVLPVSDDVMYYHRSTVEIGGLNFVFKVEMDIREQDSLLHQLGIQKRAIDRIDCLKYRIRA
jgi:hypothetical protein